MPAKTSPPLRQRLQRIKLLLCDVDGVLTDGSIFIGGEREFKRFNIRDGLGLVLARRAGLKVGWVSARPSLATKLRADELKIDFLVQQGDNVGKTAAIEQLLAREKLNWSEVCFVGDDIIDLGPLTRAGLAVAVGDAMLGSQSGGALGDPGRRRPRRGARGRGIDFESASKMAAVPGTLRSMSFDQKKLLLAALTLCFLPRAAQTQLPSVPLAGPAQKLSSVTYFPARASANFMLGEQNLPDEAAAQIRD